MANEPIPRRDVSSSRSWRDRLPRAIKRVMTSTSGVSADRSLNETLEGLSDAEVASRIARYGFNELPSSKPPAIIRIAFEVVREPMLLLPPVVAVVIAITLDRERKTERALEALRDWWVLGSALAFLALVLYVPFLKALFPLSTLHPNGITLCAGVGAVRLARWETLKAYQRRRRH